MLKPIALAALLALTPIAALAAPQAPDAALPTRQATAAARAEADRLIAEADARDLFTNITDNGTPTVRHNRSGMVCTFGMGQRGDRILVFNQGVGIARSDDVGCNKTVGDVFLTHYATRYTEAVTAKDALTDAAAAIKQRWPEARWYEGQAAEVSTERPGRPPLPQTWLAHYVVEINGADQYTSARTADHDGWIFKQRATVPLDKAMEGQLLAAVEWMGMLEALFDRGQVI